MTEEERKKLDTECPDDGRSVESAARRLKWLIEHRKTQTEAKA